MIRRLQAWWRRRHYEPMLLGTPHVPMVLPPAPAGPADGITGLTVVPKPRPRLLPIYWDAGDGCMVAVPSGHPGANDERVLRRFHEQYHEQRGQRP